MSDLYRLTDGDALHIIHGPNGEEEVVRGVLVPVAIDWLEMADIIGEPWIVSPAKLKLAFHTAMNGVDL